MSATLHLPLADPFDVRPSDETRLRVLLRELEYNSDRYLATGVDPHVDALIAEKKQMIAHQQRDSSDVGLNRRERRLRSRDNHDRYLRFREINRVLAEKTDQQRSRTGQELDDNRAGLDANSVLQDREFSFALFPEEKLRPFMTSL